MLSEDLPGPPPLLSHRRRIPYFAAFFSFNTFSLRKLFTYVNYFDTVINYIIFSSWNEPNTSDSSKGRYTGLDFYEDPFKNSNVRYGDPFDLETSDPFSSGKPDPFSESGSAFGSDPFTNPNSSDPFGAPASASDPFGHGNAFVNKSANGDFFAAKSSESFSSNSNMDPFGSKTLSIDPFGSKPAAAVDPFTSSSDPFGSKNFSQTDSRDPFGSSFSGSTGLGTASVDPFSSNSSNFANDPFRLVTALSIEYRIPFLFVK